MVLLGLGHLHVDWDLFEERGHLDAVKNAPGIGWLKRISRCTSSLVMWSRCTPQTLGEVDWNSIGTGTVMDLPSTLVDFTNLAVCIQPSGDPDGGRHSFERRNKLEQGLDHQLLDLGLGIDRFRELKCSTSRPVEMSLGFSRQAQTCRSGYQQKMFKTANN